MRHPRVETRALQKQKHTGSVLTQVSLARLTVTAALAGAVTFIAGILIARAEPVTYDKYMSDMIVAVLKRYPTADLESIERLNSWGIHFYNDHWHLACNIQLKPKVRLGKCHPVHV
jgi:hypothetical protein